MMNDSPPVRFTPLIVRRRFLAGLSVGMLALLLSAALGLMVPGERGFAGIAAAIAKTEAGANLLSILRLRSPGSRTKGELVQTKLAKHAAPRRRAAPKLAHVRPRQRALAKVQPAQTFPDTFVQPLFGDQKPQLSELGPISAPQLIGGGGPGGIFLPGAPLVGVLGGGGGGGGVIGGGGGGTPTVPTTPTTPVVPTTPAVPAVPEPATWMMMLLGFGLIGMAQRRRPTLAFAPAR